MKKQIILGSFLALTAVSIAQQWSTNAVGGVFNTLGGMVGIGNSTPQKKLDILLSIYDNYDGLKISHPNQNGNVGLFFKNNYSGNEWQMWSLAPNHVWSSGTNNFCIYDGTSSIPQLHIQKSTGNISVGNFASEYKLDLSTSVPADGIRIKQTGYGSCALYLNNGSSGGHNWGLHSLGQGHQGGTSNFTIYDHSANDYRLFINGATGNVGIGTITPDGFKLSVNGKTRIGTQGADINGIHNDAMLSVDGKIICKSLYVTSSPGTWADYVFEEKYKLPKLCEVESFYKIYHHLPEIPSEKEIIDKGIDITEMNKLLLKKVEELTIYLVDQQKQINDLKNQLK